MEKFFFVLFLTLGMINSDITGQGEYFIPQIFEPLSQQFLTALIMNQQIVDRELDFDCAAIENEQVLERFNGIRPTLTKSIGNILEDCKIFRLKVKNISLEQTNNLIRDFNEEVLSHASYLYESAEIFHERIHTLLQLSDDQFLRIRASQVKEMVEMYLITFREESKEFNQRLTSTLKRLNELKAKASDESYFKEQSDEPEGILGLGDESEGLESLYVHDGQQQEL
jgi:hypothetical protein